MPAQSIVECTSAYEKWVAGQVKLVASDVEFKHQRMAKDPFSFMRATYYRWAQLWPEICADLAKAPAVLAIGDLHLENFGTWRDAEGRLIWGINDADEAAEMPYAADLVRVATSALIADPGETLGLAPDAICAALLEGYGEQLAHAPRPFVLEEQHAWLRDVAVIHLRDPEKFWSKMNALPEASPRPEEATIKLLEASLPEQPLDYDLRCRIAGLGSLGRERYAAMADWHGGRIAREIKSLVPSGWGWARGTQGPLRCREIALGPLRARDPWLRFEGIWVLRRLSPHCSRIELSSLTARRDGARLLRAMGRETANIHLGTPVAANAIADDLRSRKDGWLRHAATAMQQAVMQDWTEWAKHMAQ